MLKELKMQKTPMLILAALLSGLAIPGLAQRNKSASTAPKSIHIDLKAEKAGAEPKAFLSMVGNWSIVQDDGRNCLVVDGREWMRGQPAGGLAEKAREIYGSRDGGLLANGHEFAYFP